MRIALFALVIVAIGAAMAAATASEVETVLPFLPRIVA